MLEEGPNRDFWHTAFARPKRYQISKDQDTSKTAFVPRGSPTYEYRLELFQPWSSVRPKMRIVDIMSEDLVVSELKADSRDNVLREIVERIVSVVREVDAESALRVLVERERIGSTGVGQGIAIPHAKLASLKRAVACFARSPSGVDFGSLDSKPAHLFLTLLVPEGSSGIHLKALARGSRLLKDADFRKQLLTLSSDKELWTAIYEKDTSGAF